MVFWRGCMKDGDGHWLM